MNLSTLLDNIRAAIAENNFDNQFEQQHVRAAAHVAFNLAFCTRVNPDDEATLASRPRRRITLAIVTKG